jgi:hypothetical protein
VEEEAEEEKTAEVVRRARVARACAVDVDASGRRGGWVDEGEKAERREERRLGWRKRKEGEVVPGWEGVLVRAFRSQGA